MIITKPRYFNNIILQSAPRPTFIIKITEKLNEQFGKFDLGV